MDLNRLQFEQNEWSLRNFPDQKPYQCLLGAVEELGELAHAHLKLEQKIRLEENHLAKKRDAIGDIIIYLAGYCSHMGFNFAECVSQAWDEVKKRNWIKENS